MQVYDAKGNIISLTNKNFLASGGAGSVHVIGSKAYKIYHDASNCISEAHLNNLAQLKLPNIVNPEEFLYDSHHNRVGYTMKAISAKYTLEEVYAAAFKKRHNVSNDKVLELIRKFKNGIDYCHSNEVILVDINPLNFVTDDAISNIFFLDVDSYQTKQCPASFINPTIRDYSQKGFNELSDWYSYGIVTFNLLTGIHPFGGKYLKDLHVDKDDIIFKRMKENLSVFSKDAAYPPFIKFDMIPKVYLDWYKALFVDGKRLNPPTDFTSTINLNVATQVVINKLNSIFNYSSLSNYPDTLYINNGFVVTKNGIFNNRKYLDTCIWQSAVVINKSIPYYVTMENSQLSITNLQSKEKLSSTIGCESFIVVNNDIYVKNINFISKVDILNKYAGVTQVAQCTEKSTQLHDGLYIQNLLGKRFASIFNQNNHHQIDLNLDKSIKIIDAKYKNKILIMLLEDKGKRYKELYRFADDFTFEKQIIKDSVAINAAILQNGVCLLELENEFYLFKNTPQSKINSIAKGSDSMLQHDFVLTGDMDKVIMQINDELYHVVMK